MENREDTPIEIYNRGKNIVDLLEKYSAFISMAKDDEKESLKEKVVRLNGAKESIKDELYKVAKEKSGLDYSKKDKNPELLRKEYNNRLEDIKKKKHELRLEKIRIEKFNEEKKAQMKEQFQIASEKYKMMLDMGKITEELYNARIKNMEEAKLKDRLDLSDALFNVKEEYNKLDAEANKINGKLEELEQKEIIYNEYGDVYYRLFGEVLADRNKLDKTIDTDKVEGKKENEKTSKEKDNGEGNLKNNFLSNNSVSSNAQSNSVESKEDIESTKVSITSKSMFDEMYKRMKKGTITDNELSALTEMLENPDNYDRYGITTGIIFNKAKKILKYQGVRTAKNIEIFLRENGVFNENIKFDASIEKNNILSHDVLNSWKDIDEKLTYTDAKFSIEKYIDKIEKYKEAGNKLTDDQENILKKAISIKNSLGSYRKAVNVTEEVTADRDNKDRNSIFYLAFKNKVKTESRQALPGAQDASNERGYIVIEKPLDFSSMVENEPTKKDLENSKINSDVNKNNEIVK